jgi:hypothetical protein
MHAESAGCCDKSAVHLSHTGLQYTTGAADCFLQNYRYIGIDHSTLCLAITVAFFRHVLLLPYCTCCTVFGGEVEALCAGLSGPDTGYAAQLAAVCNRHIQWVLLTRWRQCDIAE